MQQNPEKITDLYDKQTTIEVGRMLIGSGIEKDRTWIENYEGEGGDFPTADIEKLLKDYFDKHF